jgi:uncharacterized protein YecE (DUF72 family)
LDAQADLFDQEGCGDGDAGVPGGTPQAAERPDLVRGLRLPAGLRLGTSSWAFPGWRGLVYSALHPETTLARNGLAAYARHPLLRTVGVDRGYYRPVPVPELRRLSAMVPPDFRFLLKAPAQVTSPLRPGRARGSNPDFLDPRLATDIVVRPFLDGLREYGGVLLFQFPPTRVGTEARALEFIRRLGAFLRLLPSGPVYAVEVRDPLLWSAALGDVLRSAGAVPCYSVHPRVPPLPVQLETLPPAGWPVTVCRWMLAPAMTYGEARDLLAPFERIQAADPYHREILARVAVASGDAGRPTFIIVNNKAEGCAPASIEALAARVGERLEAREMGERARQDSNLGPSA